ncbi:MAG: adenosylcobinamide-phosphate synthase CbiB [Gemmataceae bacterium]
MTTVLLPLVLGFLLDQLLGDPLRWPHPVRAIGRCITFLEPLLRRWLPERLSGVVLVALVIGGVGGLTWGALALAEVIHPLLRLLLATMLIYQGLAARSLAREAQAVLALCAQEDWKGARGQLSRIVGRDTSELPPEQIYRACIETVAENASDGVVAPLFYAALAGPVGMWLYKAINTLDSMIGYRNAHYLRFGWASARLDDLANFIPARLTWLLLALAAALTGHSGRGALVTGWRDGRKHPSPNAGWPEAGMAGALGVRLGGPSTKGGQASNKPYLGEECEPLSLTKARQAIGLMVMTSWLALVGALAALALAATSPLGLRLRGANQAWREGTVLVPFRPEAQMAHDGGGNIHEHALTADLVIANVSTHHAPDAMQPAALAAVHERFLEISNPHVLKVR